MESGTPTRSSRRRFLAACSSGALAALAGCAVQGEPSDLEGEIVMDGSNTVFPHGAAVAEEFQWRNGFVRIPASGSGTGAGFQRFCAGETVVQNASRAVLPDEVKRCHNNDTYFVELPALRDGLAIWANPENDWCDCLTVDELDRIWQRGSDVQTWRDVRPDDPSWPDEEINLYGRDSASGTFDYFTRELTGGGEQIGNIRSDYSASADTNVIVRGVRGSKHGLGFGGAGYYYENENDLKLIAVDDGNGCIRPTRETIETDEYTPLTRDMYIYFRTDAFSREEVRAFARFFFSEVDEKGYELGRELGIVEGDESLTWTQWAARRVGYYAIPDERVDESSNVLEDAISEVTDG